MHDSLLVVRTVLKGTLDLLSHDVVELFNILLNLIELGPLPLNSFNDQICISLSRPENFDLGIRCLLSLLSFSNTIFEWLK